MIGVIDVSPVLVLCVGRTCRVRVLCDEVGGKSNGMCIG